jgi:hypothetical protein
MRNKQKAEVFCIRGNVLLILRNVAYKIAAVIPMDGTASMNVLKAPCQSTRCSRQIYKHLATPSTIVTFRYSHLVIFIGQLVIRCLQ